MASDTDVMATDGAPPAALRTWALAALVLAASTALFNAGTVVHIGRAREIAPRLLERYKGLLERNDTRHYLAYLGRSADSLRAGKVYVPVGDFDCPITYLLPAGAAVVVTGLPPLVVHNLFYLAIFFLNGLTAFAFLRAVVRSTPLALAGALAYQGCNFVFCCHYLGHMNNVQLEWLPLAFLGTYRLLQPGRAGWWGAALLGAAMGMQVLSSPYYTIYLAFVALPAFLLAYAFRARREGALSGRDLAGIVARLAGAGVLAALLSAFYLVRRLGTPAQRFSPPTYRPYALDHYLELLDPSDPALFVGLPSFVLAVLALRWWWHHPRPLTTAVVVTAVAALVMMLPAVPGTPYWIYFRLVPMFQQTRVPLRFFPIFFLMLTTLNLLYLDAVSQTLRPPRRCALMASLFCALAAFNWVASPWVCDVNLVAAVKRALHHKSPARAGFRLIPSSESRRIFGMCRERSVLAPNSDPIARTGTGPVTMVINDAPRAIRSLTSRVRRGIGVTTDPGAPRQTKPMPARLV